jgi:2-(1,2-epoxy-1,2-dihydrophenyl)acetyl-CoA isomerase
MTAQSPVASSYLDEVDKRGPIPPFHLVKFEVSNRVATVTLNDPATLNCYSPRMTGEIRTSLTLASEDRGVRAIILTGNGPAFTAGGDIRRMRDTPLPPAERHEFIRHEFGGIINLITNIDKPVIAAINGHAMGVGLFTALACDMQIASEKARLGTAYIKIGLTPLGVSHILATTIGYSRAFELCALGDIIEAHQAQALGLITRVVPHDMLMPEARALALRLADGPPRALAFTKQILRRAIRAGLEEHLALGEAIQPLCLASADHKEALDAFVEKRKPNFTGL